MRERILADLAIPEHVVGKYQTSGHDHVEYQVIILAIFSFVGIHIHQVIFSALICKLTEGFLAVSYMQTDVFLVADVIRQAVEKFGGIDVLINNAQASASGVTIADHTTAQLDLAMYSGLYAAFYYMKHAYPYLKESRGSVINFASGAGLFGNFGQSSYAAAKEAIRGLTRVAATEWAVDGINANVVCPLAWTAQLEKFHKDYPLAFEENVEMPPMGFFGDPEKEIGRVCVQLAGPDFKYMTGETITLEGGLGLRP